MNAKHAGGCLCGAVQFEIEGDFELFYLCHCEYCRRDTGSAHAANLFSPKARIEWISGEEKITRFNLPNTRHIKWFCSVCGSALPNINGDLLVVPAGSLDTEVSIKPDAHLFVASKAGWDNDLEKAPKLAGLPT